MENLLLVRIDDRLIHGQVMTAWMKTLPAKQIIVIDDKVARMILCCLYCRMQPRAESR